MSRTHNAVHALLPVVPQQDKEGLEIEDQPAQVPVL
jgi:hypothetical protein